MSSAKTILPSSRLFPVMSCLLFAGMSGCVTQPVQQSPDPQVSALQQRVQGLEHRIEVLERRIQALKQERRVSTRKDHQLTRQEAVAELQGLYLERERLLRRYTAEHPDVRRLDVEIAYLRDQLRGAGEKPQP